MLGAFGGQHGGFDSQGNCTGNGTHLGQTGGVTGRMAGVSQHLEMISNGYGAAIDKEFVRNGTQFVIGLWHGRGVSQWIGAGNGREFVQNSPVKAAPVGISGVFGRNGCCK